MKSLFGKQIGMYGSELASRLEYAGLWPIKDNLQIKDMSSEADEFMTFFENNWQELVTNCRNDREVDIVLNLLDAYLHLAQAFGPHERIDIFIKECENNSRIWKTKRKRLEKLMADWKKGRKDKGINKSDKARRENARKKQPFTMIFGTITMTALVVCFTIMGSPVGIILGIIIFPLLIYRFNRGFSCYICSACKELIEWDYNKAMKKKQCKKCGAIFSD